MSTTASDSNSLLIRGATIFDAVSDVPLSDGSILIEQKRIKAVGSAENIGSPDGIPVIDAHGKYAIPGLMNANVHLLIPATLDLLAKYADRYEELIAEAAQIALKSGLTTVFDTWGPRRHLIAVRDDINAGKLPGARIFCAGNIIGFDGPCSSDFSPRFADAGSSYFVNHIDSIWVENVGRHLMWLTPSQVAQEVRKYLDRKIDFLKYASNEHGSLAAGAFLEFSPAAQEAIVAEAHRAGMTAQAHCMSVEGLRIALEAGCDLITHCNITGPTPIPDSTLDLFIKRRVGAVVFPFTRRRLEWMFNSVHTQPHQGILRTMFHASDANVRRLIDCGAMLMLANDAGVWPAELVREPQFAATFGTEYDNYLDLADGHFIWFKAMEEKGCRPMEMLRAATINIAIAYGKESDLGSIRPGKIADIILLDKDPFVSAEHYRSIHSIVKEGQVVDRASLPLSPILTATPPRLTEEEPSYVRFLNRTPVSLCPMCTCNLLSR